MDIPDNHINNIRLPQCRRETMGRYTITLCKKIPHFIKAV
ncbi:hypothetical protein SALWKB12_0012 [Snodgrassella communis]|uniref:Uncharacterized protein n=1 Tax=Snodgrassella communis TaxID=2946699 RepID=A0A836MQ53_9NEIS|nr:hypothetical protein SALWKB12_0012 [Snodgrassella communis]KDN14385.1 hypothetical protein SALWKB29_1474 [Snodgrassella communis]